MVLSRSNTTSDGREWRLEEGVLVDLAPMEEKFFVVVGVMKAEPLHNKGAKRNARRIRKNGFILTLTISPSG